MVSRRDARRTRSTSCTIGRDGTDPLDSLAGGGADRRIPTLPGISWRDRAALVRSTRSSGARAGVRGTLAPCIADPAVGVYELLHRPTCPTPRLSAGVEGGASSRRNSLRCFVNGILWSIHSDWMRTVGRGPARRRGRPSHKLAELVVGFASVLDVSETVGCVVSSPRTVLGPSELVASDPDARDLGESWLRRSPRWPDHTMIHSFMGASTFRRIPQCTPYARAVQPVAAPWPSITRTRAGQHVVGRAPVSFSRSTSPLSSVPRAGRTTDAQTDLALIPACWGVSLRGNCGRGERSPASTPHRPRDPRSRPGRGRCGPVGISNRATTWRAARHGIELIVAPGPGGRWTSRSNRATSGMKPSARVPATRIAST